MRRSEARPLAPAPFESLERRTLMSAAVLVNGVLRVTGSGAASNTIIVAESSDGASVNVSINWTNARGEDQSVNSSFPKALGISEIRVRGGGKNDLISVGQPSGLFGVEALDLPTRVWGLGGNDVITTSVGNDVVFAGGGNDVVGAGGGNDWVRGEGGNDALGGGDGDDLLNGGAGDDALDGQVGNDSARGEAGNDVVTGGVGDDVLFGGLGNDTIGGGDGNDALWGGHGDDLLGGGEGDDTLGGILGTNTLLGENGADTFHVRDLAFNPTNDLDTAEGDVLTVVTVRREGPRPPVF